MTQIINTNEVAYKKPEWLRKKLTPHTQVEMENLPGISISTFVSGDFSIITIETL